MTSGDGAPWLDREALRERALRRLEQRMADGSAAASAESADLIHELTVHQAELEVQNEELRRAQIELEVAHERYIDLYELAPIGYLTLDHHGSVRDANLAAARLTGLERERLIGQRFERLLQPDGRDRCYTLLRGAAADRSSRSAELPLAAAHGSTRWVHAAVMPCSAPGHTESFRVTLTDITDRKHAEDELRDLKDELEQRVAKRTLELEERSGDLRRLVVELSGVEARERQRLAVLLHDDLQQVLVGIRFHLESAIGRVKDGPQVLEPLNAAVDLLREAVEKARNLSHELSPTVLRQHGLVAGLRWLAHRLQRQHGLEVRLEAEEAEIGDTPEAITLLAFAAVRELLFNIVKHAGVTEAEVLLRRTNGHLQVAVHDEGRGFDPTYADRGGPPPGLGLLGIRERVEALGGAIEVESIPGDGCRVRLEIPLADPTDSQPALRTAEPAPPEEETRVRLDEETPSEPRVIRVVLADDHEVMREGLAMLIAEEDDMEVVREVGDGQAAVDAADELRPDVVVMDFSMPRLPGDEATRRLLEAHPETHVIGLTMFDEPDVTRVMLDAGAEECLSKSGRPAELIAAIRRIGAGESA